jgi:uncharacterized protein (DUF736 family)
MSYEHKANTGTLFPNNKKADNHPDYKGKIKVGDQEYDIAGWVKTTDKGQFLSLKISEPFNSTTAKGPFQSEPQSTSEKISNSSGLPF